MATAKIKVSELAKKLGMSNAELVDLAKANMIDVKGPSSTLVPAFADIIEKKARAEGLVREVQPEEPKAAKKTAAKKTATKKAAGSKAATDDSSADAVAPAKKAAAKKAATPKEAAPKVDVETPVVEAPIAESPAPAAPEVPAATVSETPAPAAEATPAPAPAAAPASGARVISGRDTTQGITRPMTRPAPETRPAPATPTPPADGRPAASAPAGAPSRPSAPPPRPMSPSGRPVPPPPGRPMSASGRPVPPPPGGPRTAGPRPGGYSTGPRPGGAARPAGGPRPGGFGGPRPGGGPGGPGRPGGGPGGGPGGPGRPGGGPGRPGGGPRPSGGRRAPRGRRRRRGEEELQPGEIRYTESTVPVPEGIVVIERGVSAQEFAPRLNRTAADVVRFLMKNGEMVTATMTLADEQMELFALDIGAEILLVEPGQQEEMELQALFDDSDDIDEEAQQPRPPVITVMGHVDHGKTTLLDRIRNANVVEGEAGGITQHIGAYQTEQNGKRVTFIDTPGHAAFTKMRARGAQVTDIVVLMVAADDGVMPQTVESINHAKAAGVPIVVALNKIDKPEATDGNIQRILGQLAEQGLNPVEWGGETEVIRTSAVKGEGIQDLLDMLDYQAELRDLKADAGGRAVGTVLEAQMEEGRGPVARLLVQEGTLKKGDFVVVGRGFGRVRDLVDAHGKRATEAGPSTPVAISGIDQLPDAGDRLYCVDSLRDAEDAAEERR
ncbi:MAG: translation initiation factor IF-2, partial [Ilumatobacteraceae bacterium]